MKLAKLLLSLFTFVQGQELVWDNLTEAQKQVAREVYKLGKPYNQCRYYHCWLPLPRFKYSWK